MNLYIIRHGNPNYALDCLTPLGHEQAEAAAKALETLEIDEIYSSPYGRARETAAHLAERINKPVSIEPWAHEVEAYAKKADGSPVQLVSIGGDFLRSPEIINMGERWTDHPRFDGANVRDVIDEVEGGLADFMRRQGYVLEGERFRALDPKRPNNKNIALFCHAGVFLVMTSYLLRIPHQIAWNTLFMYTCGYTWCNLETNDEGWGVPRYYAVNVTNHMTASGIPLT